MEASDASRWLERLAESEETLAETEDSPDPVAQRQIRDALDLKWKALRKLGRMTEAIGLSGELVQRLNGDASERSKMRALSVLTLTASDLQDLGDEARAIDVIDATLVLADSVGRTEFVDTCVVGALSRKFQILGQHDVRATAPVATELVRRFSDSAVPLIHEQVTRALVLEALWFSHDNEIEDAVRLIRTVKARLEDVTPDSLLAEAVLVKSLANGLSSMPGAPRRGASAELLVFVAGNTLVRLRELFDARLVDAHRGWLADRRERRALGTTQARWKNWRLRLEVAIDLNDWLADKLAREDGPEFRSAVRRARKRAAFARLLLGHLRRGAHGFEVFSDTRNPANAEVFHELAEELKGRPDLFGQVRALGALFLRAQTLGGDDARIRQIAYDDSVQPIIDRTSHRSVRWFAGWLGSAIGKDSWSDL